MCIACELGLMIAMDALPHEPPPGFPRAPMPDTGVGFACEAPDATPPRQAPTAEDERRP